MKIIYPILVNREHIQMIEIHKWESWDNIITVSIGSWVLNINKDSLKNVTIYWVEDYQNIMRITLEKFIEKFMGIDLDYYIYD